MPKPKSSIYEEVTQSILAKLEAGVLPWRKPWQGERLAMLPRRVTGEPYRGINVVLLWLAGVERGYRYTSWMTYRQAAALGGQVRKGEKSSLVVKVGTIERKSDDPNEEPERLGFVRSYRVFNVAQIDDLDSLWYAEPDQWPVPGTVADPRILNWFARTGVTLISSADPRAYYDWKRDHVHMPLAELFESPDSYSSTLLHEAIHATGSSDRLDRAFGPPGTDDYAREELIGELGAAFAAAQLGLAPDFDQNAAYLDHWIKILRSDSRAMLRTAAAAQSACDWLIERAGPLDRVELEPDHLVGAVQ